MDFLYSILYFSVCSFETCSGQHSKSCIADAEASAAARVAAAVPTGAGGARRDGRCGVQKGVGVCADEDAGARESADETEKHRDDGEKLVEENAEGEAINEDGNDNGTSEEEKEEKDEDSE